MFLGEIGQRVAEAGRGGGDRLAGEASPQVFGEIEGAGVAAVAILGEAVGDDRPHRLIDAAIEAREGQ